MAKTSRYAERHAGNKCDDMSICCDGTGNRQTEKTILRSACIVCLARDNKTSETGFNT